MKNKNTVGGGHNGNSKLAIFKKCLPWLSIGAVFLSIFLIYDRKNSLTYSKSPNSDSSKSAQVAVEPKEASLFNSNNASSNATH